MVMADGAVWEKAGCNLSGPSLAVRFQSGTVYLWGNIFARSIINFKWWVPRLYPPHTQRTHCGPADVLKCWHNEISRVFSCRLQMSERTPRSCRPRGIFGAALGKKCRRWIRRMRFRVYLYTSRLYMFLIRKWWSMVAKKNNSRFFSIFEAADSVDRPSVSVIRGTMPQSALQAATERHAEYLQVLAPPPNMCFYPVENLLYWFLSFIFWFF